MAVQRLRAYNFFYFSILSMFISFLPIYLTHRGISPAELGLLVGVGSFIGILSQPFWGMLSDRAKTIKRIILLTVGFSVAIGFLLFTSSQFSILFLLVAAMYFFLMPTDPLTESLNYRIAEDNKISFGSIRTYGAIGFASSSLVIGWMVDVWGMDSLAWLYLTFGTLTFAICLFVPDAPASKNKLSFQELKQFFSIHAPCAFSCLSCWLLLRIEPTTASSECTYRAWAAVRGMWGRLGFWLRSVKWCFLRSVRGFCRDGVRSG